MESVLALPFKLLVIPNLKIKKPSWLQQPSAMQMFAFILVSYFLVTGGQHFSTTLNITSDTDQLLYAGIIYDIINEPPSIGSTTDDRGHSKPMAFLPYRVNGQYIMEGLASSFLFTLGGLGFILLDHTHNPATPRSNRMMLICVGFSCILVSFVACFTFMRIKLPYYLLT